MSDAPKQREQRRMAAIRRLNHAMLSLRDLANQTDLQDMNDVSSEAELRIQGALTEIQAFRALIYTK